MERLLNIVLGNDVERRKNGACGNCNGSLGSCAVLWEEKGSTKVVILIHACIGPTWK